MRYLLDTHVLVWWQRDDRRLSKEHRSVLARVARRREQVAVSAVSLWEIAKLIASGRLSASETVDDLLAELESSAALVILPLTARIVADSTRLGASFPSDPIDQLIAATARCNGLTLLTSDERILAARSVDAIG